MTTIEYDLDLTGGLMEEIHRLVAPPQTDDKTRRLRVKERIVYRRPGKIPNHDCCDSCKEGGDLLCCDRCPAAFHLQCHDPPLEEDDVPPGEWLCHYCITRPHADDDDTGSSCSSKSRQSDLSQLPATTTATTTATKRLVSTADRRYRAGDGDFPELDFADATDEDRANPLRMLAKASKVLNPSQFELPKDVVCPINFPGSSKLGSLKRKPGRGDVYRALPMQRNVVELDKGLVPLPAKLCFMCSRSCRIAPLIQCDYCPLLFHLDCLNPPLTAPPCGRWMCPNHVEHVLDELLLGSVKVTDRVRLWDKYTGPIDPDVVKLQFLKKVNRKNPTFRLKQQYPHRVQTKVPSSIKFMYASVKHIKAERHVSAYSSFAKYALTHATAPNLLNENSHAKSKSAEPEVPVLCTDADRTFVDLNASDVSLDAEDESSDLNSDNVKVKSDNQTREGIDRCDPTVCKTDADLIVKQECTDIYDGSVKDNREKLQVLSDADGQLTDVKPSLACPDEERLRGVRALLYPNAPAGKSAILMKSKTLTIGTGSNMDLCLSLLGHCNLTSVLHACIFYDEMSGEYELLNYSDYGTTVNDLFYASDYVAKPTPVAQQKVTSKSEVDQKSAMVSTVRQLVQATRSSQRDDSENNPVDSNTVDEKNQTYPLNYFTQSLQTPCRCVVNDMRLASEERYGWDGSALVYHGSTIRIGCFEFVFCVVGHESFDDTISIVGD